MLDANRFPGLLQGARNAFGAARQKAWDEMTGDAPIEEDQLFWLIDEALPKLEQNWTPLLQGSGVSMRLSGVFCHKTPLAVYRHRTKPSGPRIKRELGDLLLVHDHHGPIPTRRAVLMQAKRMQNGLLKADNPEQARLYSDWPLFELRGRGGDGSSFLAGDRDFSGSRDGVRYLILDDDLHSGHRPHGPYCCTCGWCLFADGHADGWLVSDPRGTVGVPGSEDLATTFVNMLFDVHPPRGQKAERHSGSAPLTLGQGKDFDVTVHEFLTKTFTKELLTTKRGRHARARGQDTGFMGMHPLGPLPDSPLAFLSTAGGGSDTSPPDTEGTEPEEGAGAIAIVLVETIAG